MLVMFSEQLAGGAIIKGGGPCALRGWCFWPGDHQYDTEGLEDLPIYLLGGNKDDIVKVSEIHNSEKWLETKVHKMSGRNMRTRDMNTRMRFQDFRMKTGMTTI